MVKNTLIILIVVLTALFFFYSGSFFDNDVLDNQDPDNTDNTDNTDSTGTNTPTEVQEYFNQTLQQGVIDRLGQPIEGFEPTMFMSAWAGLEVDDFDEVDALLGVYVVQNGEIVFNQDDVDLIHSAAHAISEEGMETLLNNVSNRLNQSISTEADIDKIISLIDTKVNGTLCQPEQRNVGACIQVYQPVCGKVNVQCITTPCPPVLETFGNSCEACSNSLVESYTEGECSF